MTRDEASVSNVECALLVEDAVARLRHDVFNSLAAVRNAAFYLQRRCKGTEIWQSDPRVEQFFQLIGQQLDAAVARIGVDPKVDLPHHRRARVLDGAQCVRAALDSLPEKLSPGRLKVNIFSGRARVDPDEFELALLATLGYLREAVPDGQFTIEAAAASDGYEVALEARPLPGATIPADESPAPRSLVVARRVAVAASGRFALERGSERVRVTLAVPDGAELSAVTRVLIVDDEIAGRATLAALLELDGHEVVECSTLAQASAALNSVEDFHAVLVDRKLPDGRGDTLAASIRSALPDACLILITGEGVDSPPAGFDAAYQKGMDPTILTELVSKLLQASLLTERLPAESRGA